MREFNVKEKDEDRAELMNSPLLLSRLQRLDDTIYEFSLESVRSILKKRGISSNDIREIENLPRVILRLLRRALTSPFATHVNQVTVHVDEISAATEAVSERYEWHIPPAVPKSLNWGLEDLTPPEDYLLAVRPSGRGH